MGRYGGGKNTTSEYKAIDVRYLHQHGYLKNGAQFSLSWSMNGERIGWIQCRMMGQAVILSYRHRRGEYEEWESTEYPVGISYTPCNYGGFRPWLHCPARECDRRVAILYGGAVFACRHCHQLAYESQRERDYERALRRSHAIRKRLGGWLCVGDPFPDKPKGMHWSTYRCLKGQYDHFEQAMDFGAARRFGFAL